MGKNVHENVIYKRFGLSNEKQLEDPNTNWKVSIYYFSFVQFDAFFNVIALSIKWSQLLPNSGHVKAHGTLVDKHWYKWTNQNKICSDTDTGTKTNILTKALRPKPINSLH